jgi:hypothetical protein
VLLFIVNALVSIAICIINANIKCIHPVSLYYCIYIDKFINMKAVRLKIQVYHTDAMMHALLIRQHDCISRTIWKASNMFRVMPREMFVKCEM